MTAQPVAWAATKAPVREVPAHGVPAHGVPAHGVPARGAPASHWAAYYSRVWGFALVPVPQGEKGPRHPGWNQPGGYFTDAEAATRHWEAHPQDNMGVLLGASALVSLDVDEPVLARIACRMVGLDLGALLGAAVRIAGRPQRERALFRLPEPKGLERRVLSWPGAQGRPLTLLELRAGAVQDLLPPSVHPGTGAPYRWLRAPWQAGRIPQLPEALLALWRGWDDLRPELEAACPWSWKEGRQVEGQRLDERGEERQPAPGARLERRESREGDSESWDEIRYQLRRRVALEPMLAELGAERRGGSYLCPFHEESHPSFWTFDTGEGYELWVDAHGGAPVGRTVASGYSVGDVIDIYQALHGLPSPGKAAAELARCLGLFKEGDG